MSTRVTQTVRTGTYAPAGTGGAARVTQTVRTGTYDLGTVQAGGSARVTQVVRVVIRDRYPAGGGMMLMGVGS